MYMVLSFSYKDTLLPARFLTTEMDKQPLRHILNTPIQQRQVYQSAQKHTDLLDGIPWTSLLKDLFILRICQL